MKKVILLLCASLFLFQLYAQKHFDTTKVLQLKAPKTFHVIFYTTKGKFTMSFYRAWSPLAVDRVYQLFKTKHFNNNYIFRSTKSYTQFGISNDTANNFFWERNPVKDEPLQQSNTDSIVSFANSGPGTRSMQIFINMKNNPKLDTIGKIGFPPIGKVTKGMNVVRKFNTKYGDDIAYKYQDSIYAQGNIYLQKNFPDLDRIKKVKLKKN
jgi:cyclophilin family peptidyl-prolyl cis-trans isomerase